MAFRSQFRNKQVSENDCYVKFDTNKIENLVTDELLRINSHYDIKISTGMARVNEWMYGAEHSFR